jgi:predicted AlkP superfamily pyrophosphatase or phosphodiesterase
MKYNAAKRLMLQWLAKSQDWLNRFSSQKGTRRLFLAGLAVVSLIVSLAIVGQSGIALSAKPRPKVIVVSLDSMNPAQVQKFIKQGVLSSNQGIGLIRKLGISAEQNVTATPSLTAVAHITIGTGSTAARTNVMANSFHLVASPFASNVSGFGAPIGGYDFNSGNAIESANPTAEPLWVALRNSGKKVIAATFPGADGVDVRVPGITGGAVIQPNALRTVDFTVPFGAFGGAGAQGFNLTAADFTEAPAEVLEQLQAAGKASYSPVQQRVTPETFIAGGVTFNIQAAAIDTSDDSKTNYDTLVFYDVAQGIPAGPFTLPATGPAYVKATDEKSGKFYLEGTATKAGAGFYVTKLAPDLSTVRFMRYSANFIPGTPVVQADVDAINNSVGFWAPQPDFRIVERISPGFEKFPDVELESAYRDLVKTFVDYQTRVAVEAIKRNPDADLALLYVEQPDGSGHQFTLTDPRQATDFTDPNSIGAGQDLGKVERYKRNLELSYQVADRAIQRLIKLVGTDKKGRPKSNIILVSDHGMAPFHTAVNLPAYLASKGFNPTQVRAITSGPAVNVYISLQGREPNGTVTPEEYVTLKQQVAEALRELNDTNSNYVLDGDSKAIFDIIEVRPDDAPLGLATSEFIGQDGGDVFAIMTGGYNFDGTQAPVVARKGDAAVTGAPVFSVPNFYGAHGYDSNLPQMSAIFYAAGPDIGKGKIGKVRNIDVAPTVLNLLGVEPSAKVEGQALNLNP